MTPHSTGTDYQRQAHIVAQLLEGKCLPPSEEGVSLIETHISWVLLAGPYAYKIKKAVNFGFLDFTSLEQRQFFCHEEIRLNARMAPDIYLDVISIGGSPDNPMIDAQPVMEYAVRMHRFSVEAEMDKLVETDRVLPSHIDSLAQTLAHFHLGLPTVLSNEHYGSCREVRDLLTQNFTQLPDDFLDPLGQFLVTALLDASEDEYSANETVIENRHRMGFIRECHGDLHLGNIVIMNEKAIPFDGIEFDPALRWIDVMCDVAFPFMDFQYYGRSDFAYRFLNAWLEITGDYDGLALLRLYASYRAAVRAKVNAIRANQQGMNKARQSQSEKAFYQYLSTACSCLVQHKPVLIITHGLPGSGKTTFSQAALERLGAIRIRSDIERKRLFGLAPLERSQSGDTIYNADATSRTYAALHDIAHGLLKSGYRVIVDAAFLKHEEREAFRTLAKTMSATFAIASIQADESAMRDRITARMQQGKDASEADVWVLEILQASNKPLEEHELNSTITFTNNGDNGFVASDPGWKELEKIMG
jgi:uncharacterized protein